MQQIPWEKIKVLEDEIKVLKSLGKFEPKKKKITKPKKDTLYGILKGVKFSDEEIESAIKEVEFKFDADHILHQKHGAK